MMVSEFREYSEKIDLMQRRLLNLNQFRAYAGDINETSAKKFLSDHLYLVKKFGNKVFVDRILFDQWCDANGLEMVETNNRVLPKVRKGR